MVITKEWLNKHKTARGSWTKRQLSALGIEWPATKGWQKRLIGTPICDTRRKVFESPAISNGSRDKTKELQQQIIGLNKKVVELEAIISSLEAA